MLTGLTYPFHTEKIQLDTGETINYIDEGKGEQTILFIHGLASYAMAWKKNIEELRHRYRCIAIDLPGNGLSSNNDHPYGINYFSGIVYALIQHLHLKHVTLAGHSMGGQVAIHTALLHPQLFDKLILCAPAGLEHFSPFEAGMYQSSLSFFDFFSTEENSLRKLIRSGFYHHTHQGDDMVADLVTLMHSQPIKTYRKMVDTCIHGMLHEPVLNKLQQLQIPTLIIFGDRDALIPNKMLHPITTRKMAEEAAAMIPNAQLHIIHSAGHFVQWEKAGEVNELIADFMG